ncbi:polysaccharide deacetylase family protein [Haliea sp. E17]|uniref:polysaccharide deacetylase family protein n=1 Tax=Haliea sp. E17 TaxID=3401576 RepID=UPI003AAD5346
MKSAFLQLTYTLAYCLGIIGLFYKFNRRPIVVSYHNIIPDASFDEHSHFLGGDHRVSEFERHMEIITGKLEVVNELVPGKVLITFDDGYKNNLTIAEPILRRHGINATFFVPACYFESSDILWIDKILMWISFVPTGSYLLAGKLYNLDSTSSRRNTWNELWRLLLDDYSVKSGLIEEMQKQCTFEEIPIDKDYFDARFQALSDDDMESLKKAGNKIACHSYNHDILAKLSPEELFGNFEKCQAFRSNFNVSWYSYPFGRDSEVTDVVVETCKNFGYSYAFMNIDGKGSERYRMTRVNMPNSGNKALIHAKLSGFEAFLKELLPT